MRASASRPTGAAVVSRARTAAGARGRNPARRQPIAAERLHALGIVNRLAVPGAALRDALAWADSLAGVSPNALARIKQLLDDATAQPLDAHS
jgi:enoyl-CoA hydratase/carnithine racemase